MQKNDLIELEITDITAEGSGIGRYDGIVIFTPLTAVGDIARVKILKVKKTYAYAKLEEIVSPSPDRITDSCGVFRQCGGCVFRHISYEAELRLKYSKVYESMKRIGGIDIKPQPIIPSEKIKGYRNKAQYPVASNGTAGFFAPHSHRIIPCGGCALQPEIFGRITAAFSEWIKANSVSVYDEAGHCGLIRHIYIRTAEKTGEIMVCAVINGARLPFAEDLIKRLTAVCGESLKSVQYNINREKTNVILGQECHVIYGGEFITDILCGLKIRLSPLSFYQVNRSAAERLYKKAAEYAAPRGQDILDLYCGAGTIGLSMAGEAKSIIGAEIVPEAVKDARYNAEINGIENAEFICADAADAAKTLAARGITPGAVIVDPPRKGLSPELIETVAQKIAPPKVVYISCDPATLARDVKLFSEKGYALSEYTPVDMFPRTAHVETVVMLSHKKPDSVINVKVRFGEGEGKVPLDNIAKRAEAYNPKERVTYKMIKEYIEAKYGFKVHTEYIAEVKRELGLPMYDAPNAIEELKQLRKRPTAEKAEAIKDALEHFGMICVGGHDE